MASIPHQQLRPNSAFWSALRSRTTRPESTAGFNRDPLSGPIQSLTVNFTDHRMAAIPVPKWSVGTALVGKVDENGIVDLTEQDPLVIVAVRKTPRDHSPASAFNRAREEYPSLRWRERSSIYNGTGMRGEAPPYWCMLMTRKADGSVETDIGCGLDSLEGVVDGLVRSRPKAPCGRDAPPSPQCPDCKQAMVAGYTPGTRHGYSFGDDTMWREIAGQRESGAPEIRDLPVRSFRCPSCGLLRNYAFTHADWSVWDKAERERAEGS